MTAERAHPAGARDVPQRSCSRRDEHSGHRHVNGGPNGGCGLPEWCPGAPAAPRAGRDTADELREESLRLLSTLYGAGHAWELPGQSRQDLTEANIALVLPYVEAKRRLLDAEARAQAAEATVQRVRELVKKHDGWERINRDRSFRFATQKARQAENFHLGMAQAQESSARHLRRALDGGAS